MNINLLFLSCILVFPIFAMKENQLQTVNYGLIDTLIFLLEDRSGAEETSCCGVGRWQKNKPVGGLAAKITKNAQKNGLTEEHRAKIIKYIRKNEEETVCDKNVVSLCSLPSVKLLSDVAECFSVSRGYAYLACCFAYGYGYYKCKHKGRCPQLEEALAVPRAVSM